MFFIEAFGGTCDGNRLIEEHIVHQVGFLCVASTMCVYQMTGLYMCGSKKFTGCAAIQYPSHLFFSQTEKQQLQTEMRG